MPNDDKIQTIAIGGTTIKVRQVEILKRDEHPNEYELEDGSLIRVLNPSAVVYRVVDAPLDWEGNPSYYVKNGTSVIVVRGPKADT